MSIEIKATITASGFTYVKRNLDFDELYWLSLADYNSLSYKTHRITKQNITPFTTKSAMKRDRATVNFTSIVAQLRLQPLVEGRIGIIKGQSSQSQSITSSLTAQVQQLVSPD